MPPEIRSHRPYIQLVLIFVLLFGLTAAWNVDILLRLLPYDSYIARIFLDVDELPPLPNRTEDFFDDPETAKLCSAIERCDIDAVKALLTLHPDINQPGKHGVTPLLWALLHRYDRLYEPLLDHGADPDHRVSNNVRLYSIVLQTGDSFLLACAKQMQYDGLDLALQHSKTPDQRDINGNGVLPLFIKDTISSEEHGPHAHLSETLETMLNAGLGINDRHANGNTPIHFAFRHHVAFAIPLLERGADPLLVNDDDEVALDWFFSTAKYDPESTINNAVFRILQEQGYVDEQISLSELIREMFPDWTVPPKFSRLKRQRGRHAGQQTPGTARLAELVVAPPGATADGRFAAFGNNNLDLDVHNGNDRRVAPNPAPSKPTGSRSVIARRITDRCHLVEHQAEPPAHRLSADAEWRPCRGVDLKTSFGRIKEA